MAPNEVGAVRFAHKAKPSHRRGSLQISFCTRRDSSDVDTYEPSVRNDLVAMMAVRIKSTGSGSSSTSRFNTAVRTSLRNTSLMEKHSCTATKAALSPISFSCTCKSTSNSTGVRLAVVVGCSLAVSAPAACMAGATSVWKRRCTATLCSSDPSARTDTTRGRA